VPTATPVTGFVAPDWVKDGKQGGVLLQSTLGSQDLWDPHQGGGTLVASASSPLFSQLLKFNPVQPDEIVGDLAYNWELNGDGSFTFFIDSDAVWSDGVPVTAADVKFSLDRMVEDGRPRPKVGRIKPYYDSTDIIDDHTIQVNMKIAGSPAFLQYLGINLMKILPKHVADQFDTSTDEGKAALEEHYGKKENVVGSGPFLMVKYEPEVEYEHRRNPNYFKDGLPFVDSIEVYTITDRTRLVAAYKANQVLMPAQDDIGLGVRDLEAMEKELAGQVILHWVPPNGFDGTFVNPDRAPFDDARVRKALYLSIDRLEYIKTLLSGRGQMGTPFLPRTWMTPPDDVVATWPGFRYVHKETGEPVLDYYGRDDVVKDPRDIAEANALLADAGYGPDNPLSWTYTVFTLAYHTDVAALLREQWKVNIGAEVTLAPKDIPTGFAELRGGDYQMGMVTAPITISDSDEVFLAYFQPGCASYRSCYQTPELDDLFNKTAREADASKRQEMVQQAGEIARQGEGYWRGIAWIERFSVPINVKVKNYHQNLTLDYGMTHEHLWLDE
jgi:ABC-type transport system substrate-binding protein